MRMFSKGLMMTMVCATLGLGANNANALGLKQWDPITINGYMDNTRCLKDWLAPCGTFPITRTAKVYTGTPGVGAIGAVTFKDWGSSYFMLRNLPALSVNGELIMPGTDYKFVLSGNISIKQVYRTSSNNPNYTWYPCDSDKSTSSMTLTEAIAGKSISCRNTDSGSWLMGLEIELQLTADLYRTSPTSMNIRSLPVPTADLVFVMQGKNQNGAQGTMRFDDVFIDGGKIRLNDRKCFINLTDLKVDFGQLTPTGDSLMRKEVPTEIPLFCSGFTETIGTGQDAVVRKINGAGIKNTINGISIEANQLADGNTKRIALPERTELFVEVGQDSQKMCNTGTTIAVDNSQKVGGPQENGPVWDQPGKQDGRPVKLYWRLCQKDANTPLQSGAFKDQPAAKIRVHYN